MAQNNFAKMADPALAIKLKAVSDNVNAAFASYGLTALQSGAWETAADDFATKLAALEDARIAFEAAVEAKEQSRAALLGTTSEATAIIYAFPGITPQLLSAAGLAVYATTNTPKVPSTPGTPTAQPFATGDVLLKWNRGDNAYGITFGIEAKSETGDWSLVASTTATKIRLSGYTPGVGAWFRIVAFHRGVTATPTLPVAIYVEGEGSQALTLAA